MNPDSAPAMDQASADHLSTVNLEHRCRICGDGFSSHAAMESHELKHCEHISYNNSQLVLFNKNIAKRTNTSQFSNGGVDNTTGNQSHGFCNLTSELCIDQAPVITAGVSPIDSKDTQRTAQEKPICIIQSFSNRQCIVFPDIPLDLKSKKDDKEILDSSEKLDQTKAKRKRYDQRQTKKAAGSDENMHNYKQKLRRRTPKTEFNDTAMESYKSALHKFCPTSHLVGNSANNGQVRKSTEVDVENESDGVEDDDDPDWAEEEFPKDSGYKMSANVKRTYVKRNHSKSSGGEFKLSSGHGKMVKSFPANCAHCDKKCSSKHELKQHIATFHKAKRTDLKNPSKAENITCSVCDLVLKSNRNYRHHLYRRHRQIYDMKIESGEFRASKLITDSPPVFVSCAECGIKLKQESLRTHLTRVHHKRSCLVCEVCGFITYDSTTLGHHKMRHSDERPFKCTQCSFSTKLKTSLTRHVVTKHQEVTKVQCSVCGILVVKEYIRGHMRKTHEAVPTYACSICGELFRTQRMRQRHESDLHLQVKTTTSFGNSDLFNCSNCPFTTKIKKCLQRHFRNKHEHAEVVVCPICGESLKATSMYGHVTRVHKQSWPIRHKV